MKTHRSALTVFSRTASSEIPCSRCWPTAVTTPNSMTAAAEFGQLPVIRVFGHYDLGTTMSFRLVRGATLQQVVEHYRRRTEEEGPVPDMPGRFNCALTPGPTIREKSTLQRARFTMRQNPRDGYGDTYLLVVRCERKWAGDEESPQKFAAVVEICHPAVERLYERVRQRIRVRIRA